MRDQQPIDYSNSAVARRNGERRMSILERIGRGIMGIALMAIGTYLVIHDAVETGLSAYSPQEAVLGLFMVGFGVAYGNSALKGRKIF